MMRTSLLKNSGLLVLLGCLTLAACAQPQVQGDEARAQRVAEMYAGYVSDFPDVRGVSVEELDAMQRAGKVTVVDVRPKNERDVSMIPGAISAEELEADLERYRDTQVVAYCTIGYRSGVYAKDLQARGLKVLNLKGSILAWTHAGKPLVNSAGPTRKVHVYGARWDLAADGYEAIW